MSEKKEKPELLRAFSRLGIWHIWSAFSDCSSPYYKTAETKRILMVLMYDEGYRLICQTSDYEFYFELRNYNMESIDKQIEINQSKILAFQHKQFQLSEEIKDKTFEGCDLQKKVRALLFKNEGLLKEIREK